MGQDKFLILFGTFLSDKAKRYGEVDGNRLPDDAKKLLAGYRTTIIGILAVFLLLMLRMKLWSLAFGLPLLIGGWVLKGHFESRLDPLLEPYFPKANDKNNG